MLLLRRCRRSPPLREGPRLTIPRDRSRRLETNQAGRLKTLAGDRFSRLLLLLAARRLEVPGAKTRFARARDILLRISFGRSVRRRRLTLFAFPRSGTVSPRVRSCTWVSVKATPGFANYSVQERARARFCLPHVELCDTRNVVRSSSRLSISVFCCIRDNCHRFLAVKSPGHDARGIFLGYIFMTMRFSSRSLFCPIA